jgi:ATP-dependent Clp protease ATP-binding subunit ClpA
VGKTEVAKQLARVMGVELLRLRHERNIWSGTNCVAAHRARRRAMSASIRAAYLTDGVDPASRTAFCCWTKSRRRTMDLFNILLQVMDHGKLDRSQRQEDRFPQCRAGS